MLGGARRLGDGVVLTIGGVTRFGEVREFRLGRAEDGDTAGEARPRGDRRLGLGGGNFAWSTEEGEEHEELEGERRVTRSREDWRISQGSVVGRTGAGVGDSSLSQLLSQPRLVTLSRASRTSCPRGILASSILRSSEVRGLEESSSVWAEQLCGSGFETLTSVGCWVGSSEASLGIGSGSGREEEGRVCDERRSAAAVGHWSEMGPSGAGGRSSPEMRAPG